MNTVSTATTHLMIVICRSTGKASQSKITVEESWVARGFPKA
jgi:hypothetical protein